MRVVGIETQIENVCTPSYHRSAGGDGMADDPKHFTTVATKDVTNRNPSDASYVAVARTIPFTTYDALSPTPIKSGSRTAVVLELPQTAVEVVEGLLVDRGGRLEQLVQQGGGDRAVWDLHWRHRA